MGKSFFWLWIFQTMGSLLGQEECEIFPWLGLTFVMPFPDHLLTSILSYQNMAGIWWFYQNVTKIKTLWGWCACALVNSYPLFFCLIFPILLWREISSVCEGGYCIQVGCEAMQGKGLMKSVAKNSRSHWCGISQVRSQNVNRNQFRLHSSKSN